MATSALRSLWAEPRPTNAPDRGPRDWALVAALVCWSLVEVVLRQAAWTSANLAPRPLLLLAMLAVLGPLLWRRTHPLVAVAVSFGALTIVDIVRILTGSQGGHLNSISAALILAYALFRWGSGREAASGLGVILLWLAITTVADTTSLADTVAAYGFFLFAAALGAAIRYRTKIHIRDIDQAKAREREQLARTPRHRRPPRLGHRHPGPGRWCHRGLPPRACHRGPGHHRGRSDPHPHRAARHRRRAPRLTGHRVLAAARRGRGPAARHRWPDASLRRGDALRRVRRPQPGGRGRGLPPGPGVHHQRSTARPPRDPGDRRRHRRRRPGTADHRRRRLRRWRPRPSRLRPGGHAGTRLTARRHLPRRPRRRAGLAGRGGPAPNRDATMSIRVLIADDQPIVRTGLTMLLDAQPDIDVVGAAADGREAVRLALQLRPDVGLFDIRMPLMDGIEATRRLAGPEVTDPLPIVVITTFDLDEYVHGALKAGARGFLLKDAGPALLTQAIHAAADGDALIAPSVTVRLLAAFAHAQTSPPRQPIEPLTAREEEVLVPVAQGRTNNEIASELYITPSTVKAHLASLMRKLGARNRVEVAMWAHEAGRI